MSSNRLQELPNKIDNYLYKISGLAVSNKHFEWGINLLEKYRKKYIFSENREYMLGLLYDHQAMYEKKKKSKANYLNKARKIYRDILQRNPKYFLAKYGIGRTYSVQRKYEKAKKFQVEAYKEMIKLPKRHRGALAIGHLFEEQGDYKMAERWYLREYKDCKRNDFGTVMNLMSFYKKIGNHRKAIRYALKTEKLAEKEFKKKIYSGINMNNTDFVKSIKREIEGAKRLNKSR